MPPRVFPFLQLEMPFELGVPDGRWMVREQGSGEVRQVIVLATVPGRRADRRQRGKRRAAEQPAGLEAPAVPVAQATVIAAQPLPDEAAAGAWIEKLDAEREIENAFTALNRLIAAHRIAAADPYAHEVAPSQALALRAGFGLGEQVAEGRWTQARELSMPKPRRWRRGKRAAILRSQERLASLLASQHGSLLCEELALRARLDLDQGRLALAAGELERALGLAVRELEGEPGADLPQRVAELQELRGGVSDLAAGLLGGPGSPPTVPGGPGSPPTDTDPAAVLSHALGRLEAALRARAVALAWH